MALTEAEIAEVTALIAANSAPAGSVDAFYLLYAGALVFLMQAGFAMLCAGSLREKNIKNIMLKNLLDACVGAIGFYCVGFGLASRSFCWPGWTFWNVMV